MAQGEQKFDYENREVLTRLRAKLDELVKVKAAVAAANAEVYDKIFRLAELKGLVTTLSGLDTKAGLFHEGRGFGEAAYEVEYVAQLGKVDVDKLVVAEAYVTEGPRTKRVRPAPMGRAYRYQRRSAHIAVTVAES